MSARTAIVLLSFFFLGCSFYTYGQTIEIDSLRNELKKETNSKSKIKILNKLSYAWVNIDPEESVVYNDQALVMAQQLGDTLLIFENLLTKTSILQKKDLLDSAILYSNKVIESSKHNMPLYFRQYIDAMSKRGTIYYYQADYSNAVNDHMTAIRLSVKYENKSKEATARNNLGLAYWRLKEYESAIQEFEKSLDIREGSAPVLR